VGLRRSSPGPLEHTRLRGDSSKARVFGGPPSSSASPRRDSSCGVGAGTSLALLAWHIEPRRPYARPEHVPTPATRRRRAVALKLKPRPRWPSPPLPDADAAPAGPRGRFSIEAQRYCAAAVAVAAVRNGHTKSAIYSIIIPRIGTIRITAGCQNPIDGVRLTAFVASSCCRAPDQATSTGEGARAASADSVQSASCAGGGS
jgi:hypothetical protein